MTSTSRRQLKSNEISSKGSKKDIGSKAGSMGTQQLPWWVEILFVQIGLPDNWLRSFLKNRKRLKITICENKKAIGFISLTTIFIIYYNPIRKESALHNECVFSSINIINDNIDSKFIKSKLDLKAYAVNFCNGGDL